MRTGIEDIYSTPELQEELYDGVSKTHRYLHSHAMIRTVQQSLHVSSILPYCWLPYQIVALGVGGVRYLYDSVRLQSLQVDRLDGTLTYFRVGQYMSSTAIRFVLVHTYSYRFSRAVT